MFTTAGKWHPVPAFSRSSFSSGVAGLLSEVIEAATRPRLVR